MAKGILKKSGTKRLCKSKSGLRAPRVTLVINLDACANYISSQSVAVGCNSLSKYEWKGSPGNDASKSATASES